jgi:taurine transport system permease protein
MSASAAAAEQTQGEARATRAPRRAARARGERKARLISLTVTLGILAFWAIACWQRWVSPLFLPSPWRVAHQAIVVARDGYAGATLAQHAGASLFRVGFGFALAALAGIPLGLAMGAHRLVKAGLDPVIEFYWPLPPLAYLPLMIIWLGIDETSKVTLLALAMFAPICLAAQSGVRSVLPERVHMAKSLGATRSQVFRYILLPSALPEIFTGLRIAIGVGWGTLVAAELVAAQKGIGFMILSASNFLATDIVFIGIAAIAVLAIGSSMLVRTAERLLVPWKGHS